MIDGRNGILPNARFGRNFRTKEARMRTHIAMGQLVPRLGEGVGELIGS